MKAMIFRAALVVLLLPAVGHAQLFKCKDANGKIAYQETPCPTGEQKRIATDKAPDPGSGSAVKGPRVTGTDQDKRIALDRSPSADMMQACVKHHRPDLTEALANFNMNGRMAKRIWLTSAGPAERLLVTVLVSEKPKLGETTRAEFTCALRAAEGIDAAATRDLNGG